MHIILRHSELCVSCHFPVVEDSSYIGLRAKIHRSFSRNNKNRQYGISDNGCNLYIDTETTNKLLSTTPDREIEELSPPKAVTSPNEPMTSLAEYSANTMTSLWSDTGALLWMHHGKMAAKHSACAEVFPPTMHDLSMTTSNPTLFPFPVHSLPPLAFGHRRAVVRSWNMNSLPQTGKELINTATLSLENQPFLSRLPWQPPLCCLLQPEVARRYRANVQLPLVGGVLPTQELKRITSRRVSPVNWLLSDDVRVTSSARRDPMWNSPVDRRPTSGAVRQRSAKCDGEKRPATPGSPVSASAATSAGILGDRKLACRHCGKPYASLGALKMHIRTHTLPCRCQLCGKAFSRPWLLQGHLRTHTGERPFACPQCGRAFADRSNLRAHLQTHAELKKYACDRCTKTFSRLSLLVKHRNGPAICGAASSSSWRP